MPEKIGQALANGDSAPAERVSVPAPASGKEDCSPGLTPDSVVCKPSKRENEGAAILRKLILAFPPPVDPTALMAKPPVIETRDVAAEKKLAYVGNPGNYCGPSALVTALSAQGTVVRFDDIASRVNWPSGFLGWKEGVFTAPQALADVAHQWGHRAVVANDGSLTRLFQEVDQGRVPLVLTQGDKSWSSLHFLAVTGYQKQDGKLTHVKVVSNGDRLDVPVAVFEKLWNQVALPGVKRLWIAVGPQGSASVTDHLPKLDGALHSNVVGAGLSEAFVGATHLKPQVLAGGLVKTVVGGTGAGLDYAGREIQKAGVPVAGQALQGAGKLVTYTGGLVGGVVTNSTLKTDVSGNGKVGVQLQFDGVTSQVGKHQLYVGPVLRYQQGAGFQAGAEAGARLALDRNAQYHLQPFVAGTHTGGFEAGVGLNVRPLNNVTISASVAKTPEEGVTPRIGLAVKY